MEPIIAVDIYNFFQQNRLKFRTQKDLIEGFIAKTFELSIKDLGPEAKVVYRQQINKLVSKFRKILQKLKHSQKKRSLEKHIFISAEECNFITNFVKQNTLRSNSSSEDEDENESDADVAADEKTDKHVRKPFAELTSQRQRLTRTKELMKVINAWVIEEQFPLNKLLGFIGYSQNYKKNKKLARVFETIMNGKDVELKHEVPLDTAIFMKERGLITKRAYNDMRLTLKPFVLFPTYNAISYHIRQIMPELRRVNNGIMARVIDVAKSTITRLPSNVIEVMSEKVKNDTYILFKATFFAGLDGSGGFAVYNSKSFLSSSSNPAHLITVGMALNRIEVDDNQNDMVYTAQNICSFWHQRPIALIPGKESRQNMKDVVDALDIGIFQGKHNEYIFDFGTFKARFKINIVLCQIDSKMIKNLTGLTGAYCTACVVSESQAHIKENIIQGFKMDRTVQNMERLYSELKVIGSNGEEFIPKKPGDYKKRLGLCKPPLTKTNVCSVVTILHSYLNALTFFQRLLYALNAGVYKMSSQFDKAKFTSQEQQDLKSSRERLVAKARGFPLYMKLDTHDSSTSSGTSDTGNLARKFFSSSSRKDVLDLIEGAGEVATENRSKIKDLLQRFSIILRILSSKSLKIAYESFQKFCSDTYLATLQYFDWIHIPGSIHRLLGHSAERIHVNDNYGLGSMSEEGLESSNKMVRRFRQLGSRKMGLKECLYDVYSHWWAATDGKIRAASRSYQCQKCFESKPSTRGRNLPGPSLAVIFDEIDDESLFESFILF